MFCQRTKPLPSMRNVPWSGWVSKSSKARSALEGARISSECIGNGLESRECGFADVNLRTERAEFFERIERLLLVASAPEDVGEVCEGEGLIFACFHRFARKLRGFGGIAALRIKPRLAQLANV